MIRPKNKENQCLLTSKQKTVFTYTCHRSQFKKKENDFFCPFFMLNDIARCCFVFNPFKFPFSHSSVI